MGLKDITINMALVGIFAFSMISFGAYLAIDNGSTQSILDDDRISTFRTNLNTSLNSYDQIVNSTETAFSQSEPTVGAESLQIKSVANIWKPITTVPYTVYRLTLGLIVEKVFSDPAFRVVFIMITSLLVVILILYAWQFIRGGAP